MELGSPRHRSLQPRRDIAQLPRDLIERLVPIPPFGDEPLLFIIASRNGLKPPKRSLLVLPITLPVARAKQQRYHDSLLRMVPRHRLRHLLVVLLGGKEV